MRNSIRRGAMQMSIAYLLSALQICEKLEIFLYNYNTRTRSDEP